MNVRKRSSAVRKGKGSAALIATLVVAVMVAASASFFIIGGDNNSGAGGAFDAGVTDTIGSVSERSGYTVDITGMSAGDIEDAIVWAVYGNPGVDIIVIGKNDLNSDMNIELSDAVIIWAAEFRSFNTVSITGQGTFILDEDGSFEVISLEFINCKAELNGELRSYYGPYKDQSYYVYYGLNFVAKWGEVTVNTQLNFYDVTNITVDGCKLTLNGEQYLGRTFFYVVGNGLLTVNGGMHFGGSDAVIMAGYIENDSKTGKITKLYDGGTIVINGDIFGGEITAISAIGHGSVTINGSLRGFGGTVVAGGAYIFGMLDVINSGTITVNGDVMWADAFIAAFEGGSLTINGNVFSSGNNIAAGLRIYDWREQSNVVHGGGTIFINGSVIGSWQSWMTVSAIRGGMIVVSGNVNAGTVSASGSDSVITVAGDLDATLEVINGGIVLIGGTLTTPNDRIIFIMYEASTILTVGSPTGTGTGVYGAYDEYSDGMSFVYIRKSDAAPAVCVVGGVLYSSLADALAAVTDGQTIRLLANITYRTPIVVDGKTINFNLGNYNLNLDTSSNPAATALTVTNGGKVNLIGRGTGMFNVTSSLCGVEVSGEGSEVTVNNVTLIKGVASRAPTVPCGVGAWSGASVTVLGNVTSAGMFGIMANDATVYVGGSVTASSGSGIDAGNSTVIIAGSVTAQNHGVNTYGNSYVKVGGNVRSTSYGDAVTANGNAVVDIGGKVTADMSNGVVAGDKAKVYVKDAIAVEIGYSHIIIGGTPIGGHSGVQTHDGIDYYTFTDGNAYVYVFVGNPDPVPDRIDVTKMPNKTIFNEGDVLNLTGLVITLTYSDGTSTVLRYYITDPGDGTVLDTAGTITINVSYTDNRNNTVTTSFEITVNPAPVVLRSIDVTTVPAKTTYNVGDALDLTGLVITATYSNGSSAAVTGYTTDPVSGAVLSDSGAVVVTYTEGGVTETASFYVVVDEIITDPVLESIKITTLPDKVVYTVWETLDLTGMVITAAYSYGDPGAVGGYITNPANGAMLDIAGIMTITVSYTFFEVTKTATFEVTVNAIPVPVLKSITVTTMPDKTEYISGEALDLTGLVITATYSDGSFAAVTGYITDPAEGAVLLKPGTVVSVYYTEDDVTVSAVFYVSADPAELLESISVTAMPDKVIYIVGEALDLAGLVITATFDDGSAFDVTGYTTDPVDGAKLNAEGILKVKVSFTVDGVTATTTFDVTVDLAVPVLESIGVTALPDKTVYIVGEALNLTGLVITATFSDKTAKEAAGYITDPVDGAMLDTEGIVTVTVSFTVDGVTVSAAFDVTVKEEVVVVPVLDSIRVTTMPSKTVYTAGETLDLTGLVITAAYSDGNSVTVTGYTVNPGNGTVLNTTGTLTIIVTYTEDGVTETASFTVTVNGSANVSVGVQIVAAVVIVLVLFIFILRR